MRERRARKSRSNFSAVQVRRKEFASVKRFSSAAIPRSRTTAIVRTAAVDRVVYAGKTRLRNRGRGCVPIALSIAIFRGSGVSRPNGVATSPEGKCRRHEPSRVSPAAEAFETAPGLDASFYAFPFSSSCRTSPDLNVGFTLLLKASSDNHSSNCHPVRSEALKTLLPGTRPETCRSDR